MTATDASLDLIFGADHDTQLLVLEPLFDEANRLRRLIAEVMRGLDRHRIGTRLIVLPGCGESAAPLAATRIADWQDCVRRAAAGCSGSLAWRGGALLDHFIDVPRWRFEPVDGASLLRDRDRAASIGEPGEHHCGDRIGDALRSALHAAQPEGKGETVRLPDSPQPADRRIPGTRLWRQSEPGDDAALAGSIINDIIDWAKRCARF